MIRRHRRRTTDAPFDHGQPIKGINSLPIVIFISMLPLVLLHSVQAKTHAVVINLPFPSMQAPTWKEPPTFNRITINDGSQISWNDDPVNLSDLTLRLAQSKELVPAPYLLFEPDRDAPYDTAAKILNIIVIAGLADSHFCILGLSEHRHFEAPSIWVDPTKSVRARTARLKLAIAGPNNERIVSAGLSSIDVGPSIEECEALSQLP